MGNKLRLRGSTTQLGQTQTDQTQINQTQSDQAERPLVSSELNFDFFQTLRTIFRSRQLILLTTVVAAVLAVGVSLLLPNKYTSHATILPTGGGANLSALKGITGLASLDLGNASFDEGSSHMFPSILYSARVVDHCLHHNYEFTNGEKSFSMTLMQYLNLDNLDYARADLRKLTNVTSDRETGLITLSAETKYPELSQMVAQVMIDELDRISREIRTNKAEEFQDFLEGRLHPSLNSLIEAEDALREFQMRNRDWAISTQPELKTELARLQREVEIKSRLHLILLQQFEMARTEALKDLPIAQTLDPPSYPYLKTSPRRTVIVITSTITALLLALSWALLRERIGASMVGENKSFVELADDMSRAFPVITEKLKSRLSSNVLEKIKS